MRKLSVIFLLVIPLIFVLIGCSNVYIPPDPIVEVKTDGEITKTKQKKFKIIVKNVTDSNLINVELWVIRKNISTKNKDFSKKVKNIKPGSSIEYYVDLTEEDKNIQDYIIWIEGYYKKICPDTHFIASYNYPDLFQNIKSDI